MPSWKKKMAKKMAKDMSVPERILWSYLRDKKLGVYFYKQKLMLGWILDFFCPKASLCVEVDGAHHLKRKKYDANRDSVLASYGILTMRFTYQEVKNNAPAVVALISHQVKKRIKA